MTLSVFDAARDAPTHVALIQGALRVTFAELAERVEQRLGELNAAGALARDGQRSVAVVAHPRLETVVTVLALFAAGTPALLLHARGTAAEHQAVIERAHALPEPERQGAHVAFSLERFDPERIAALMPTSGSTGAPRLVQLSHRAFVAAVRGTIEHLGLVEERSLLALPLAHIGGLSVLLRSIVTRGTLVLFEPERSLLDELPRFLACASEHAVTMTSMVPTLLERVLSEPVPWRPPSSLRALLLGGAGIPRAVVARARTAGLPVLPTYGMTETCSMAVTAPYAERLAPVGPGPDLLASGVPLPGVEVRLREGLVEVRGPTLFSGYFGEPGTAPGDGWFATHDRAHLDPNGAFVVTGRASDLIITGGENVDPLELEAALSALPFVHRAYVFGVPDATFGELVAALLVVAPGAQVTLESLTEHLAGRLARFKLPRRLALVPELPLTPSGKVDRGRAKALRALATTTKVS